MNGLIDFSVCPLSARDLQYGGRAGVKRGVLYQGDPWILKFPKNTLGMRGVEGISYVTSPLNEYLGSQIFKILGYDVQETILGVCFDGKRLKPVCACKDFIKDEGAEILLPYTSLRNDTSPVAMARNDCSAVSPSNLNEVLFQLEHNKALSQIPGASARFFEVALVDLLINNNDRNEDNWGVIKNKADGSYRFAPVYDCGNSFYGKSSEEKISAVLKDPQRLLASALNGVTAYESDEGDRITSSQFLESDSPELQKAVVKVYRKAALHLEEIKKLIFSLPSEFEGVSIITENRARYYFMTFQMRLEMMLAPKCKDIVG